MDEKKLQAIKAAKKKIVEGSLTIWNARLDELAEGGHIRDAIDFLGSSVDDASLTNVCGCPEPGSPKCGCKCFGGPIDYDSRINVMGQKINEIGQEIKELSSKIKY